MKKWYKDIRLLLGVILISFIWLARLSPKWIDDIDYINVKYFEEPMTFDVIAVTESKTEIGKILLEVKEPYNIPYKEEIIVLSGFTDTTLNKMTRVTPIDKAGKFYASNLEFDERRDYTAQTGQMYWEGAGGFFSFFVLSIAFFVPFCVSIAWAINLPKNTSKSVKALCYTSLWLTGSYFVNLVVFRQQGDFESIFSALAVLVFVIYKYGSWLKATIVPDYKAKYEAEKVAKEFSEAQQAKMKAMIVGWSKSELKDLEWAIYNLQFIPDLLENAEDPTEFKKLFKKQISMADIKLRKVKVDSETLV